MSAINGNGVDRVMVSQATRDMTRGAIESSKSDLQREWESVVREYRETETLIIQLNSMKHTLGGGVYAKSKGKLVEKKTKLQARLAELRPKMKGMNRVNNPQFEEVLFLILDELKATRALVERMVQGQGK